MSLYPRVVRPLLFQLDPERVHKLTLTALEIAGAIPGMGGWLRGIYAGPPRPVSVLGLNFSNPLGLAAGYDKDGRALEGLSCLGFGHLEVGTVTPEPQAGNPRPRIFRLPADQALINRMGFPNAGSKALRERLQRFSGRSIILGVNIGKGMETPLEEAASDYVRLFDDFYDLADYLAVNVSSPNTVGLRRLQGRASLHQLLEALAGARQVKMDSGGRYRPLLVKLAPDLSPGELEDALEEITAHGFDGVIVANTTIARGDLLDPHRMEGGGLSGAPLRARTTDMIRDVHRLTSGSLPIIGVGGVFRVEDVKEKLDAGASLVQLYTGLVYRGPGLVKSILEAL
ncbi:MAG: quinone-dependent dihydroorotate dehydrogenase [Anaerolineales bacterium]